MAHTMMSQTVKDVMHQAGAHGGGGGGSGAPSLGISSAASGGDDDAAGSALAQHAAGSVFFSGLRSQLGREGAYKQGGDDAAAAAADPTLFDSETVAGRAVSVAKAPLFVAGTNVLHPGSKLRVRWDLLLTVLKLCVFRVYQHRLISNTT